MHTNKYEAFLKSFVLVTEYIIANLEIFQKKKKSVQ